MDIAVQVWLRDGHVWHFRCDENDEVLVQLISTLPGADADDPLPNGVVQIDTPTGERLCSTRASFVALSLQPINSELTAGKNGSGKKSGASLSYTDPNPTLIDVAVTTIPRSIDYV